MSVNFAELVDWATVIFVNCGLRERAARQAAEALVRTEARGVPTHGLIRVKQYADKLLSGELNAVPHVTMTEQPGLIQCEADRGLGPAVAPDIVDLAVERATKQPLVAVAVRGIGHLAALGIVALRAAEAGCIALVMQSTPRVMALPGARGPAIGNNPLACASPMPDGPPLVLDIATAVVARSRIAEAARRGEKIPDGWAIDGEGHPTNDATAALAGAQLPMAGHKGLGLAMMVELLAGSLSGERPAEPHHPGGIGAPARVGAFFLVINPRLAAIGDGYLSHIESWLGAFRSAQGERGRYPGEQAAAREQVARRTGLVLPAQTRDSLAAIGDRLGHPFDLV